MFEFIWSESFWFQPGYTWENVEHKEHGDGKRSVNDIIVYPIFIALALYFFRNYILIPYVCLPIGNIYKIRSKPYKHPQPNDRLDILYTVNRARPPPPMLKQCADEIGWTERKVERWLRQKALSKQMTTLEKFNDQTWQFVYYTCYCIFGLIIICPKEWYADPNISVENFPQDVVSQDLWWYYMIATAFYLVQFVLMLQQDRRHDFYVMLTHHLCSLCILYFNWFMGIGIKLVSLSLLYHECADIPLAFGKMCFYCGKKNISNKMAIPFFVTWFSTRLYLYPYWVVTTSFNVPKLSKSGVTWPAYWVQTVAITLLFCLHLIWTKEMIPIIIHKLFSKEVIVDSRSSGEEMSEDSSEESELKQKTNNKLEKDSILRKPDINENITQRAPTMIINC